VWGRILLPTVLCLHPYVTLWVALPGLSRLRMFLVREKVRRVMVGHLRVSILEGTA
jgi:hypothetical protein